MKRFYFTAAAGIVFIALAVAYAVWLRPSESRQATSPAILSVKPDDVRSVAIERGGQVTVEIRKEQGGWQIERPRPVPTSSSAVEAFLQDLAPLRARRVIAQEGADPAQFGLTEPKAVLVLTLADGTVRRLRFGSEAPVSQGAPSYYVKDEAASPIYTVDAAFAEQVLGSWDGFRERRLAPLTTDAVWSVRIQHGATVLEARRTGEATAPAERRWRLVAPYDAPGDTANIERVLRDMEFTRVSRFVNDAPSRTDLDKYGLVRPEAVVALEYTPQSEKTGSESGSGSTGPAQAESQPGKRTMTLLVGGTAEGSERYVQLEGQPSVYTLPSGDLEALLAAAPDGWVRHQVVGLARSEIQRLSLSMTGRPGPLTLEKDSQGQWVLQPGGRRPKQEEVDALFDALWRLRGDKVVAVGRSAQGPGRSEQRAAGTIEITVAGHDSTPVTRLSIPVVLSAPASGGGPSPRTVSVEQGSDRLAYEVSGPDLAQVESTIAQWTAPESGATTSGSH